MMQVDPKVCLSQTHRRSRGVSMEMEAGVIRARAKDATTRSERRQEQHLGG
jgi:hypothetical protein